MHMFNIDHQTLSGRVVALREALDHMLMHGSDNGPLVAVTELQPKIEKQKAFVPVIKKR